MFRGEGRAGEAEQGGQCGVRATPLVTFTMVPFAARCCAVSATIFFAVPSSLETRKLELRPSAFITYLPPEGRDVLVRA